MIAYDLEQGSRAWLQIRVGIPTSSQFDRIISPKTLRLSSSAEKYRTDLLIEWLRGEPIEGERNEWMERGTLMEPEARAWYEIERDCDVQRTGFVTRDDGLVGGSPDGLICGDGLIEIKCPSPNTMDAILHGKDPGHVGQCQGLLYVTERDWCDLVIYHPDYPPIVNRVVRDDRYQTALVPILEQFVMQLEIEKARLARARR